MTGNPLNNNREKLYAPSIYWKITVETKKKISDRYVFAFISKKIWGLDISKAYAIHKYCYYLSRSLQGKEKTDRIFLNNMLRLIDTHTSNKWLKWLRRKTAIKYYKKMYYLGGPVFWQEKNESKYTS